MKYKIRSGEKVGSNDIDLGTLLGAISYLMLAHCMLYFIKGTHVQSRLRLNRSWHIVLSLRGSCCIGVGVDGSAGDV
jgi:hypothetical protein